MDEEYDDDGYWDDDDDDDGIVIDEYVARDRRPISYRRMQLVGGIVTNPVEIERIRLRMAYYELPWWKRMLRRKPTEG